MSLFRRFALLLAIAMPTIPTVLAESSSSSSSNPRQDQERASSSQTSQAQPSSGETQGQLSVQQRIRQRREQRRAAAIHDAYDHKWESYVGTGYLRFIPGPSAQRLTYYAWEAGLARFSTERLGWVADARGYFGTAYVGLNDSNITRPAISQYDVLVGPVYRFYVQPRYAISGRAMAGPAYGNFEGDTASFKNLCDVVPGRNGCLLWPNGISYAASVSVIGELNISPGLALKLAPEYFFTGFGSTAQASRGFTGGFVYRFGRQR